MDSDTVMTALGVFLLWFVGARVSARRRGEIGTNVGILAGLLAAGWALTKATWLAALAFGLGVAMAVSGLLWILVPACEVFLLPVYDFLARTTRDWRRRRADRAYEKLKKEEDDARDKADAEEAARLAAIKAAMPPPPPPLTPAEKLALLRETYTKMVKELEGMLTGPELEAAKEHLKQKLLKTIHENV